MKLSNSKEVSVVSGVSKSSVEKRETLKNNPKENKKVANGAD